MQRYLFLFSLFLSGFLNAQQLTSDWENYIVSLKGKPVSINVDLGLKKIAPMKENPFAIMVRVKLNEPDANGMPQGDEVDQLLRMEEKLVEMLARQNGTVFAGRFTQRGLREFYFYAPDTIGYLKAINQTLLNFPSFQFLCIARNDANWENYNTVLYPSQMDLIKIDSRRRLSEMAREGAIGNDSVDVFHYFVFPDVETRKKFLMLPQSSGFILVSMPLQSDTKTAKYSLVLKKSEKPSYQWIETNLMPIAEAAIKSGGAYQGWDFVSK
ncbi:MAG: DUF695 domain-containing protein [bacterium]|jgi:hypothetical protein